MSEHVVRVQQIIQQITKNPEMSEDGELANRLVVEFQRGAPLQYLEPVLLSRDDKIAGLGAWLATELGVKGRPLLGVVSPLLHHTSRVVRYWSIECLLLWAGPSDGSEISEVIALLDDPEEKVRWKVMWFLDNASSYQLVSALSYLDEKESQSPNAAGLRWLLSSSGQDPGAILGELKSPDPRMRKFAAAAAARLSPTNWQPLLAARSSDDPEVAKFAASWHRPPDELPAEP